MLELGGRILRLPELDASVMYEIDRFGSSFWAAIHRTEGERVLSPLQRRRAQVWLGRAHSALESAVLGAGAAEGEGLAAPAPLQSPRNGASRSEAAPTRAESLDGSAFGTN